MAISGAVGAGARPRRSSTCRSTPHPASRDTHGAGVRLRLHHDHRQHPHRAVSDQPHGSQTRSSCLIHNAHRHRRQSATTCDRSRNTCPRSTRTRVLRPFDLTRACEQAGPTSVRCRFATDASLTARAGETAERTGALGYMDFADVEAYAEIYDLQALVVESQRQQLGASLGRDRPPLRGRRWRSDAHAAAGARGLSRPAARRRRQREDAQGPGISARQGLRAGAQTLGASSERRRGCRR